MRSYITPASQIDLARANRLFGEMERAADRVLKRRRASIERSVTSARHEPVLPGADLRHVGPGRRRGAPRQGEIAATIERFHQQHEELHTYASREEVPVLRSLRVTSVGVTEKPELPTIGRSAKRAPRKGKRRAYFDGVWSEVAVYDGALMKVGQSVRGPSIIEEPFTTIVLHRGQSASLDRHGNYRITVGTPRRR